METFNGTKVSITFFYHSSYFMVTGTGGTGIAGMVKGNAPSSIFGA